MAKSFGKATIFSVLLCTLGAGLFLVAVWKVGDAVEVPSLHVDTFVAPAVSAQSFLIFDEATGAEIGAKDPTKVLPIASLTKLVTATVFYETADLDATTSITWSDVNTEGDAGNLHPYESYSYRELLFPLLLESSNDAAVAILRVSPDILEHMGTFVSDLGLTQTKFSDTSGLSSQNVSTASELAVIARKIYINYPHIIDITRLQQYIGTYTGWPNNNPLVGESGYEGGKHGFTYEANRTDIAFFDEHFASGQIRTIGYVLLGSENIQKDIDMLRHEIAQKVDFN